MRTRIFGHNAENDDDDDDDDDDGLYFLYVCYADAHTPTHTWLPGHPFIHLALLSLTFRPFNRFWNEVFSKFQVSVPDSSSDLLHQH